MQGCKPLLLCRRPTRIHAGLLPLVPTATVLINPFEAALPRRTQNAEAICRQILSVEPRHAESLHLLGVFALHAGRHELAEGMIRQAIALSPGDSAFHYNFGHALREQGQMAGLTHQNRSGGERKIPGGARDSRAVCGDSPQTPDARVSGSGMQI